MGAPFTWASPPAAGRQDSDPWPISRRISDLAAEARALSRGPADHSPGRRAIYLLTKAVLLADIAAGYADLDHPNTVPARHAAAHAWRQARAAIAALPLPAAPSDTTPDHDAVTISPGATP